jgi:hypothetical protein
LEEKRAFRTTGSNCFFVKNRKMVEERNRSRVKGSGGVPEGFRGILRAKSTTIKQEKCREFYISRERDGVGDGGEYLG